MQNRKQIINRTLTLLGVGEQVASRLETENAKIVDSDIVPATVSLLQKYNFKFSNKFATLSRELDSNGDVKRSGPLDVDGNGYYAEYVLPEGFINLINVYTSNSNRSLLNVLNERQSAGDYEGNKKIITVGRKLLLEYELSNQYDTLNILYTDRILFVDEVTDTPADGSDARDGYEYPMSFCEALSITLALRNGKVIRNDPTLDSQLWNLYNKEIDSLTEAEGIDNSQPININVLDPAIDNDVFITNRFAGGNV